MIIYTNSGNPLGLELLLFAKFAKREVSVEKINANDKDFLIIPTAQVADGVRLFSTNAVALYLFGDESNNSNERNEWLEWTAFKLMPVLALNTKSNKNRSCPTVKAIVSNQLNKIEQQLQDKPFILGTTLTSVDLAIWSLLATEDVLSLVQNVDKLLKWFNAIKVLPEVQEAAKEFPLKELSFSAVLQGNRYSDVTTQLPISPTPASNESNKPAVVDDITSEELQAARKYFVHVPLVTRKEERTVLPKTGERNVLITSALPYVNNVPHLGNIIGCVLSADIFARFCRMSGYNTLYVCGTDEYGTATENKALAENLTPKEICDKYFQLHNNIYRWLFIGFDYFGRTTTKEQTEIVQSAFKDLYDNGYILKESVDQLLCQKCDRFLADRFVEGTCHHVGCGYEDARGDQCDKCGKLINATELIKPRCNVCRSPPVIRSSEQLFIDLPKIEPELRKWLDSVDNEWTHNARVITRAWLREGLKPRCITRDLKWGVPVPLAGFEKKVFYVWFDAPFGYVSMTKKYTKEYQQWWQPAANVNVEHFEFMAKDNVPFHGIMWPAILLAMNKGHTMVKHVMATEYLNYEDGKFSKSRGIGVFGNDAQDTGIAADVWRFYLASARPESQDSSFSWNDLETRNNSELLNNLGNFVNRALVFCEKNFNGVIPTMKLNDLDLDLLAHINRELRGYLQSMERAKMRDAIRHLFSISRLGNGYMQAEQPWVLLKGDEVMKARAGTIIGICCNISALLANLMFPFMPASARNLYAQLNMQQGQLNSPYVSISLPTRHQIGKPMPLFQKLEPAFIEQLKGKYGGSQATNESVAKPQQEVSSASVAELELAVQKQGEKLRLLKTTTKDKSVIQPEVTILLDLKQRLAAQKLQETAMPAAAVDVKELEAAIQKQGDKLRQLKSETKDKSIWQPEVNILLELKNKLAAATGVTTEPTPATNSSSRKNKKK